MVKPLAPLIRLFSALQDKEPGPDEPWPVMIMLDEFNRLGKMPIVAESIEVLRHYRGHLAIVTQTIPAIDEIYGENTRRALQGNAGVKLYLTPSDEKTIEELSKAVGKTTKTVVTKSRAIGKNPFEGRSQSMRTEETSLLPEDEARRLSLDEIIVVVDAQMPVRAKRVVYFEDPYFKDIHGAQEGDMPFPVDAESADKTTGREQSSEPGKVPSGSGGTRTGEAAEAGLTREQNVSASAPERKTLPTVQRSIVVDGARQIEMDFAGQMELTLDNPTQGDLFEIDAALSDLDQLEGEIARPSDANREGGVKLSVR